MSREAALSQIHVFARARKLSADEKDEFAAKLAAHLGVDYDASARAKSHAQPDGGRSQPTCCRTASIFSCIRIVIGRRRIANSFSAKSKTTARASRK